MKRVLLPLATAALLAVGCSDKQNEMNNPLLAEWTLPYGAVPFDQIKNSDYIPALKEAIRMHDAEIDAIANSSESPTFANTIEAYEASGRMLDRVEGIFFNLVECMADDEMMALSEEFQNLASEHSNNVSLNEGLFHRIEQVWEEQEKYNLTPEQQRLLKKIRNGFVRSGALLEGEAREEFRKVSTELDSLTLAFGQNTLKATNAFRLNLTDSADVAGIPEFVLQGMKEDAEKDGNQGWTVTLKAPSYGPFMTYADRRDLREKVYKAYNTRAVGGEFDNTSNIVKITSLRLRLAQLLGYKNFAAYQLENKMAHNVQTVDDFLAKLHKAYIGAAEKDVRDVENYARQQLKDPGFCIQPWDFSYWNEKLKTERYAVNDELLKPYFPIEAVKKGVFGLANRLYGLTFTPNEELPKYHPEVVIYEVRDAEGKFMGLFYADFFPRATKRGGAWMTEFKGQWTEPDGTDSRPLISICTNFTKPTSDKPSLLTFDEVETFLHEFGHSLHGLLTQCHYSALSGTNVAHDFVELFSQFNENFGTQKEFLDTFAAHYETDEKIPQEYIDRIRKAQNYLAAYYCVRQLSFGMLDMNYHTITEPIRVENDDTIKTILDFEHTSNIPTQVLPAVDGCAMCTSFTHLFSGGYAAGYYGYKWSEVLDADAFSVFQQEGIFNPEPARRFKKMLQSGDTVDPAALYREFRSGDYTLDAIMKRDGIR